jgi:anti-sigma regulatory factor (Ser/Thr protein kinase)
LEDLSLHILDIAENAMAAGARNIRIVVDEDSALDRLSIEIADDGKGMSTDEAQRAADPFTTTRTTRRVGLGLALLRQAASEAGGTMAIESVLGSGTTVRATFQLSHVDRKPLGCMTATIVSLIAAPSETDILYTHTRNGKTIVFDTKEVRHQLAGMSLNSIGALGLMRDYLSREEDTLAH